MVYNNQDFINEYIKFLKSEDIYEINKKLKIIDNFQDSFPKNQLKNITLQEYVIGKLTYDGETNKKSFCYRLERGDTSVLGSIRGGNAIKFGIYFKKDINQYIYLNKFYDKDDAIARISNFLYKISNLNSINDLGDLEKDENNRILSPMIIRKVFFMYNPEKIIPIFSTDFLLEKVENIFGLKYDNYIQVQKILLDIYNKIDVDYKNTYNFMIFLYKLSNEIEQNNTNYAEKVCESQLFKEDINYSQTFSDNYETGSSMEEVCYSQEVSVNCESGSALENENLDIIDNLFDKIENQEDTLSQEDSSFIKNTTIKEEKEREEIQDMRNDRIMKKMEFEENMKMKKMSFWIVSGLMTVEILFIFVIFFLVGINYLKFSENTLNVFIGATITQIAAIFLFIIKHLFPLKNNLKE